MMTTAQIDEKEQAQATPEYTCFACDAPVELVATPVMLHDYSYTCECGWIGSVDVATDAS